MTGESFEQALQPGHAFTKIPDIAPHIVHFNADIPHFHPNSTQACQHERRQRDADSKNGDQFH